MWCVEPLSGMELEDGRVELFGGRRIHFGAGDGWCGGGPAVRGSVGEGDGIVVIVLDWCGVSGCEMAVERRHAEGGNGFTLVLTIVELEEVG